MNELNNVYPLVAVVKHQPPPGYTPIKFSDLGWDKEFFCSEDGKYYLKTRILNLKGKPRCNAQELNCQDWNMTRFEDDDVVFIKKENKKE